VQFRIRILALIVFLGLLLTFILQNWQSVEMHFLGWRLPGLPLAIYCLLIYLLGMFTGWAVFSFVGRSLRQASERKPY
jgi:uncharacterized integral membrane protein